MMRDLTTLDQYRVSGQKLWGWDGDETCGAFVVPSPIDRAPMSVIASSEGGWDHVSVSRRNRCPNWHELEHVAKLFFRDDEVAIQFHVPADHHINDHPHCLHWWRPRDAELPLPPAIFV